MHCPSLKKTGWILNLSFLLSLFFEMSVIITPGVKTTRLKFLPFFIIPLRGKSTASEDAAETASFNSDK